MTRRPSYVPALQLLVLEEFTASRVPVALVVCAGSLTGPDGTRLRDQLRVQLRHGPRHLLLDLSEATGFGDTAAAILIDTARRAPAARCSFGLVAPTEDVLSRLQLTGLHRMLSWHETLQQALAALERPSKASRASASPPVRAGRPNEADPRASWSGPRSVSLPTGPGCRRQGFQPALG